MMVDLQQIDFVTAEMIEAVDQRTCAPGFVSTLGKSAIAEGLVVGDTDARYLIDLTPGGGQFAFYHLRPNEPFRRPGLLVRNVQIEVQRETAYSAEMVTGEPGDMILSQGVWYLVAANALRFRDPEPMRLWDGGPLSRESGTIGFQSWRMTIGTGQERRVLWKRAGLA